MLVASVFRPIMPPKRIDLPHHLALRLAANGRVAGHLPDRIQILGEHERRASKPGGSEGGFDAGMPAPTTITS